KCNGDAIEKASCILNKLKGGIKYYNIRYDEGVKTVREGDLENKVSVKSIIEIKKWREKY
ncbi:MAG: hypothetical protein GWN16_04745, partial [Calditrichae bacterium]|nr:hypothetical protein [Calditrichia bacterium]